MADRAPKLCSGMSRCIEMELARFDISPDLRRAVEPLIIDALMEYSMRHRTGSDEEPVLHLTLTQALDVLTAQQARWHPRLSKAAAALHPNIEGVPRKVSEHLPTLLRSAQEFFRREGALTLRTAAATETVSARFSILWTDYFSRSLLDWLRDHDLIGQTGLLETADILVECAKLWIHELAGLNSASPPAFNDAEREVTATLERGPVRLRIRGRMDPLVMRTTPHGLEVVEFRLGEPEHKELNIARLLLHMMLLERLQNQSCPQGRLVFFQAHPARSHKNSGPPVSAGIEEAFAPFVGNETVVHRLKQKTAQALKGKTSAAAEPLLIHGPVGHGKTLLARSYAAALNLPLIELHSASLETADHLVDTLNDLLKDHSLKAGESHDDRGRLHLRYPPMVLLFDDLQGWRRRQEPWHGLLASPERTVQADNRIAHLGEAVILAAIQDGGHPPEHLVSGFQRLDLERYRHEDVARMVTAVFDSRKMALPPALAHLMAVMGRCNPMRAKLFATELRDRHRSNPVTTPLTREALLHLARHHWHVDEQGLGTRDYQYLQALESGPRGLPALQQLLPFKDDELTGHIEPYLLQIGAIRRNTRGRSITVLGEQFLQRHRAGRKA